VSLLRAVARRLDAWAALLLGVLVALGVIILLATPGPWHRVVPAPHVEVTPQPPRDFVVFVCGDPDSPRCSGVVWVHVRYDMPSIATIVIPVRLQCLAPGAGFEPLGKGLDDVGPAATAAALGETLGVRFDGWLVADRAALREAFPWFFPQGSAAVARLRFGLLAGAWGLEVPPARRTTLQVAFVRAFAAQWRPETFERVAMVNYVLGSRDVETEAKLQAVSSFTDALFVTPRRRLTVGALPCVVFAHGRYRRWLPDQRALLGLRVSFALDAQPPTPPARLAGRAASPVVVVLGVDLGRRRGDYARGLATTLREYSGDDVRVRFVGCDSRARVERALGERPGTRPPLAAVIAPGRSPSAPWPPAKVAKVTNAALDGVRAARLPAVVAEAPGLGQAGAAGNAEIDRQAAAAGLPVALAAAADPRGGDAVRPLSAALAKSWGRTDAELLVRAAYPEFFAPRLPATRLGVSYLQRRGIAIGLVARDDARGSRVTSALVAFLDNVGYEAPSLLDPAIAEALPAAPLAVFYAGDHRDDALCVAGDLAIAPSRLVEVDAGVLPGNVAVGVRVPR
jgi:hypothetical protein